MQFLSPWILEADVCRPQSAANVCRGAANPHKRVFVNWCNFYIRNCGLIKAAALIQSNPNSSSGAALVHVPPGSPASSCCRYYLRHLREAAFVKNWNSERGMSWLLTVTLRFLLWTQLSILVCAFLHMQQFLCCKSPLHMYDCINILQ